MEDVKCRYYEVLADDKSLGMCKCTFGNEESFRGLPKVPSMNRQIKQPEHDGKLRQNSTATIPSKPKVVSGEATQGRIEEIAARIKRSNSNAK